MDLLKDLPLNFRYYLMTTTNKEILIVYYKHTTDLASEDEETMVESTFIPIVLSKYKIDSSQTVKVTVNDNDAAVTVFNNKIIEYCNARKDFNEVRLLSVTKLHQILFEGKVFNAMIKCAKKLYFDIGEGGIRVGPQEFPNIELFTVNTGILFPETTATIYADEFKLTEVDVNEYNNSGDDHVINFVAGKIFKSTRFKLYNTIKMTITLNTTNSTNFMSSKCSIQYIHVYGMEVLSDNDLNISRVSISGFNKCSVNGCTIDEDCRYGNIFKFDKITNLNFKDVTRDVKLIEKGSLVKINRVGTINIHKINYKFTKSSIIKDDMSLFYILGEENDELKRKINIFNTTLDNPSTSNCNVCTLVNVKLDKMFISKCSFSNNITLLDMGNKAEIVKLEYNSMTFNMTSDFIFPKSTTATFVDVTYNSEYDVTFNSQYVSLTNGMWNFKKMGIYPESDEDVVLKISTNNTELVGQNIEFLNSENALDGLWNDKDSSIAVKKLTTCGYTDTLLKTKLHIGELEVTTQKVLKIPDTFVFFDEGDLTMNVNGSLSGKLTFDNVSRDKKFNVNINDSNKYMTISPINILSQPNSPEMNIKTNVPVKMELYNYDSDYAHIKFNEYESNQQTTIKLNRMLENNDVPPTKLINDSEKKCSISEYEDYNGKLTFDIFLLAD